MSKIYLLTQYDNRLSNVETSFCADSDEQAVEIAEKWVANFYKGKGYFYVRSKAERLSENHQMICGELCIRKIKCSYRKKNISADISDYYLFSVFELKKDTE